ncbi:MAG: transposase [Muribaculum sp.]|nr:transposase [Muribaculum sp.]
MCTQRYVPYVWKLPWVDVYVSAQKSRRLNIFGMISRDNRYYGFTTEESINADKFISFMDNFSLNIKKKTFVVLDNSTLHRNKKVKELRPIWEECGLYIFYLPPYSPELNIAETL